MRVERWKHSSAELSRTSDCKVFTAAVYSYCPLPKHATNRDYSMRFYTLFSLQQQEIWVAVCGHEHTWQYHKRSHHHHHHHWVDSVKWQNEYNSASMDSNPRIQSLSQILQSRKPGNGCCQSQNCGTENTVYKVFINETEKNRLLNVRQSVIKWHFVVLQTTNHNIYNSLHTLKFYY